jgi:hypothetical protein
MEQNRSLHRLEMQSKELAKLIINAKQASIDILKFYQSIEEQIEQALQGAYGKSAQNNATIVQSNINKIQSSIVGMEMAIRNLLYTIKIAQSNVLWAYLAAVQFSRSRSQISFSPGVSLSVIHQNICSVDRYKVSLEAIEKLFHDKRKSDIARSIITLKYFLYHVVVAMKSAQCFENESCGVSAKMFMQQAQRYASQALDSELSVERNVCNIDWYITTVKNFASRVMQARREESFIAPIVTSTQALHL